MPKHHNDPKIPLAKQRNHWHEPVFPLTYSGYTPPPVTAESAQTDADSGAAQPRSPSKPKTKEPRMALSKFLFGGGSRRTPVLEWQKLKSRNNKHTPELYRTAVPGGWLISQSETGGLVFIPDPNHEWDGDSLPTYNDSDE